MPHPHRVDISSGLYTNLNPGSRVLNVEHLPLWRIAFTCNSKAENAPIGHIGWPERRIYR
jgi:hypothetical protein